MASNRRETHVRVEPAPPEDQETKIYIKEAARKTPSAIGFLYAYLLPQLVVLAGYYFLTDFHDNLKLHAYVADPSTAVTRLDSHAAGTLPVGYTYSCPLTAE